MCQGTDPSFREFTNHKEVSTLRLNLKKSSIISCE